MKQVQGPVLMLQDLRIAAGTCSVVIAFHRLREYPENTQNLALDGRLMKPGKMYVHFPEVPMKDCSK